MNTELCKKKLLQVVAQDVCSKEAPNDHLDIEKMVNKTRDMHQF